MHQKICKNKEVKVQHLLQRFLHNSRPEGFSRARSQFCALRGAARCVCWRAVLLEDESGGQPAIAFRER